MQEQNAAIGVAIAGYYPDLTLSGAFGYDGDPFIKQIAGANPVWSYGLSLAQPLFNGGLTDAQVEAARADLRVERRHLPPDRADRLSAGRGPTGGDPRLTRELDDADRGGQGGRSRRCRSRSTNIAPARRTSPPS